MTTYLMGKVALVTGASRGIGRAVATALGSAGAAVAAAARSEGLLETLVDEISAAGGKAVAIPADIADEDAVLALFAAIDEQLGPVDIVINNAGIGRPGTVAEFTCEDLDQTLAVNVRGTFLCCREAMKRMLPRESGYIINVASVVGFKGYLNQATYGASKHAVMGLTKSLAAETHPHGIRISAVLPGGVDTDLVPPFRPDLDRSGLMIPEDVAHTVLYLLSLSDRAAVDQIHLRRRGSQPF